MESHKEMLRRDLKRLRRSRGIDFSQLTAQTGLSERELTLIERGKLDPTPEQILNIASALGKTRVDSRQFGNEEAFDP